MSTRGAAPALDFAGVVVSGPAADGGLYVPQAWPRLSEAELCALQGASYGEIARRVMLPFVGDSLDEATLADLIAEAYAGFDHAAVAPLRQLDPATWLLELFHGPTLAFKDCALQVLGRLLEHFLERGGRRLTVIAATSGDTGSAAIEACHERAGIDIFVLHPRGRVSEVQRRQMTTVTSRNVHNIAIEGTFDDCQALVKRLFADTGFRDELALGAVNSINWVRIVAQIVYYVAAALALDAPRRRVAFSVPTGNFGDVYAGYGAARLGLPVDRLVVATNSNDILARFFEGGEYAPSEAVATMSPSMDIQVASNFERLLFDLFDGDGAAVARRMRTLADAGSFSVEVARIAEKAGLFTARRVDEEATLAAIRETRARTGIVVDPHTAVGIAAGRAAGAPDGVPLVCLATAHPAKFPEAVERALQSPPPGDPRIDALFGREERYEVLANDAEIVKGYMRDRL